MLYMKGALSFWTAKIGEESMHTQNVAPYAALDWVLARVPSSRNVLIVSLAIGGALLTGCSPPSYPLAGADPADASVPVAAVGYRSTVAPYTSLRPTTPKAWREQNERAAPAPKSDQ